ncbi:hypothetical protein DM02DRAFT_97553 [Periconia macrospinosa]|uniref:Uncharacterized protein n=1 Tax=Periconia macrospinosa TaxID=97972 RepID=A0A2V1E5H0_9PLEO|nr:hypothetical protein DM02DRAFT_97553 [Periconia macrospinosa]
MDVAYSLLHFFRLPTLGATFAFTFWGCVLWRPGILGIPWPCLRLCGAALLSIDTTCFGGWLFLSFLRLVDFIVVAKGLLETVKVMGGVETAILQGRGRFFLGFIATFGLAARILAQDSGWTIEKSANKSYYGWVLGMDSASGGMNISISAIGQTVVSQIKPQTSTSNQVRVRMCPRNVCRVEESNHGKRKLKSSFCFF